MIYRFMNGAFSAGRTFEEAKANLIAEIQAEEEDEDNWHSCTCLGLSHRYDCPENPANRGETPY